MIRSAPVITLPKPPEKYNQAWEANRNTQIENGLNTKLSNQSVNSGILLASPGGKIFLITVKDDGSLDSTLVKG